jgi:hypothetical protein
MTAAPFLVGVGAALTATAAFPDPTDLRYWLAAVGLILLVNGARG